MRPLPSALLAAAVLAASALLHAADRSTQPAPSDPAARQTWKIDPSNSSVEFVVTHLMISTVTGRFNEFSGEVESADETFAGAWITAVIQAASIDTGNERRDDHLREADFFDTDHHPEIRFASRRVGQTGEGVYRITGDLTLRGVTRTVVLESELGGLRRAMGSLRAGFVARTTINRMDFGIRWNDLMETGGAMVGHEVQIVIRAELVRRQ